MEDTLDNRNKIRRVLLRRAQIDAVFADMASDGSYQREAVEIDREFASVSWEALLLTQRLDGSSHT